MNVLGAIRTGLDGIRWLRVLGFSAPVATLVIGALATVWWLERTDSSGDILQRIEIVSAADLASRIDAITRDRDALRDRVRRLELRPPDLIIRTDTVGVLPVLPPPVFVNGLVDRDTEVELVRWVERARPGGEGTPAVFDRQIERTDIRDCEAWGLTDDGVFCDRNWLGRLGFFAEAWGSTPVVQGAVPAESFDANARLGIYFQRHRSSRLRLFTAYTADARLEFGAQWSLKLFAF